MIRIFRARDSARLARAVALAIFVFTAAPALAEQDALVRARRRARLSPIALPWRSPLRAAARRRSFLAFRAPPVDGFGLGVLALAPEAAATPRGDAWTRGRRLGNDLVEVTVEPSGALRLLDRRTGERFAGGGQ